MDGVAIARAVHVLAVVHWIGGLAFVTMVVLPIMRSATGQSWIVLFEAIEHRFSAQVKVSVPLAGASGIYMADRLDAWSRFLDPSQWWLAAMALLWALFMTILFVVEPLVLRRARRREAGPSGDVFRLMQRVHWLLLSASAVVVAGGILGVHGFPG